MKKVQVANRGSEHQSGTNLVLYGFALGVSAHRRSELHIHPGAAIEIGICRGIGHVLPTSGVGQRP